MDSLAPNGLSSGTPALLLCPPAPGAGLASCPSSACSPSPSFTKRTADRVALIAAALSEGRTFVQAAQMAAVSRVTLWRWRQHPTLRAQLWSPRPPGHDAVAGAFSVQATLGFVRSFGLLGHGELGAPPRTIFIDGRRYVMTGDELRWFLAHAANVHLIVRLISALRDHDEDTLTNLVESLAEWQDLNEPDRRAGRLRALGRAAAQGHRRAREVVRRERESLRRAAVRVGDEVLRMPDVRPLRVPTLRSPWWAPVPLKLGQLLEKRLRHRRIAPVE
jgi:hypothetical protein